MSKKQKKTKSPVTYWRDVMGGKYLTGPWVRRNIPFALMLLVFVLIYISNRYQCQQEMLESKKLSDTLVDRRYKALTARSQVQEMTLRSHVEEYLVDSTIHVSTTPPYVLKKEE